MLTHRIGTLCSCILLFLVLLTSCAQSSTLSTTASTKTVVSPSITPVLSPMTTATPTVSTTPTPTSTPKPPPAHYTSHLILRGIGRPDDLAFDQQGRLLFSDEIDGTISRLNADGSVTELLVDRAGLEGLVVKQDGTIIFAEQDTNRIVSLAPGASTPSVLRVLPGTPSNALCKHGVDGIAFDPTTDTLIVPDSPTGDVYRMSLDGKTLTLLASGIVRPVGAGVDGQGNIYIADKCGNAIWRLTPAGKTTRIGGFGMPDDVVPDGYGNVLVIDLQPSIHALIRLNLKTGKRETLANQGFVEPQGLVVDTHGNIYVADDYANIIVKYTPA
jgi:sugar lactone lactonase YvrE